MKKDISKTVAWLLFALAAVVIILISCLYVKERKELKRLTQDYESALGIANQKNQELYDQLLVLSRQDSVLQAANKGLGESVTELRRKCDQLQKQKQQKPRRQTRQTSRPSSSQSYPDLGW